MSIRNYVLLKSPKNDVIAIFVGPQASSTNATEVSLAIEHIAKRLYKSCYASGYDILIADARNLVSLKHTLPELKWSGAKRRRLIMRREPSKLVTTI